MRDTWPAKAGRQIRDDRNAAVAALREKRQVILSMSVHIPQRSGA